ncbi:flocculation protein FLO11-like isoform X7 [Micropterus salmoides]|uniref:flocculation protein FLO11-like isoform X7 n=1 Tax=Micropterus salmoides TaxID=27706 RepID=UPI0018EE1A50|nr:flocculation protein FLO11-like isoform X7 [Micropterus salmoides]
MNCQTPSSVSESQCFFYTLSGGTVSDSSCLKTLTGTELLKTSNQSSPAEVKVLCFYTVKPGELDSPSPHSDTSSITIHSSSVRTPSTKDSPFPVSTPNKASDSFSEMRAQAVLPPTLTVNPSVITETDSVTLNCQTPSSVSMSECYFRTVRGGPAKRFSCLQTLTGTELLKITNQSSPAEVKVTCFYLYVSSSPDSDVSSIIVRTSLPPKLTVNPPIITETESVTMNCQTPSSVSESQCFFYTLSGGTVSDSSCLKTLTGTELLKMAKQSSPAEVKVLCFYTVKLGELDSPSPHSDTSSITIHSSSVCTPSTKDSPFPVSTPNKASDSFSEMRAQAVLPPTLTVNPSVITETGSVTLNCQTPSSVSMSECYFRTVRGGPAKRFSCLQKLTGTELLKITNQSSPAEVKVTCFYLYVSSSPDSDVSSIIVRTSLPPKLTVNPPIITETESVTMNCQTPSSVSESQCFFYTLSGGTVSDSSCLKTLTGTELLKMANQSSPAEVKVLCFYTVKLGELDSPSPHSDTSSITIHSSSVCTPSTKDSPFPVSTPNKASGLTVGRPSSTGSFISTLQTSVKPASDSGTTPMNPETVNNITGPSVSTTSNKDSSFPGNTPNTASAEMLKLVVVTAGCGVSVGIILLVSAILWNKRKAGSEEVKKRQLQNKDPDTYHLYCTISEEPAASALNAPWPHPVRAVTVLPACKHWFPGYFCWPTGLYSI